MGVDLAGSAVGWSCAPGTLCTGIVTQAWRARHWECCCLAFGPLFRHRAAVGDSGAIGHESLDGCSLHGPGEADWGQLVRSWSSGAGKAFILPRSKKKKKSTCVDTTA